MAAITDLDDYVARLTGSTAQCVFWFKDNRIDGTIVTTTVLGKWHDMWRVQGVPSGGAVPPTSAASPDRTTQGALGQADAGGIEEQFINAAQVSLGDTGVVLSGTLLIYDRLAHISGLLGNVATAQTVSASTDRYTGAASVGNMIAVTIYTAIGTTASTITASYTDQDGNSPNTTEPTSFGGTGFLEANRMILLPLAANDTGVRSVASVIHATTGTPGNYGVSIIRPLAMVPFFASGVGGYREMLFQSPHMPKVENGGCLAFAFLPSAASTVMHLFGNVAFVTK